MKATKRRAAIPARPLRKKAKRARYSDRGGAIPEELLNAPAPAPVPTVTYDQWVARGKQLESLVATETLTQFQIGDWICEGEENFTKGKAGKVDPKVYDEAVGITGKARGTLTSLASVARNIPILLRNKPGLKFNHYVAVARVKKTEDKERLLDLAVAQDSTIVQFRQLVEEQFPTEEKKRTGTTARLTVTLSHKTLSLIQRYAHARDEKPGELAGSFLGAHVEELATKWTKEIEKWEAQEKAKLEAKRKANEERVAARKAKLEAKAKAKADREAKKKTDEETQARAQANREANREMKAKNDVVEAEAAIAADQEYAATVELVEKAEAEKRITKAHGDKVVAGAKKILSYRHKSATIKDRKVTVLDLKAPRVTVDFLEAEKALVSA